MDDILVFGRDPFAEQEFRNDKYDPTTIQSGDGQQIGQPEGNGDGADER